MGAIKCGIMPLFKDLLENLQILCHLCGSGGRNGVQRRTKVSFGRIMMQALELLQLAKMHVSEPSDVKQ